MATLLTPTPTRIDKTPQPAPTLSTKPIEGSRYWSREFMDREWDGIWTRSWLIGGLAQQVAKPGDFFTYDIGRESILVTHGEDGRIRAFYNVCPHRGKRLVDEEQGHSKRIACSYHGWRFTPDGELNFVPCAEDFAGGNPCGKVDAGGGGLRGFRQLRLGQPRSDADSAPDHLGPVAPQLECYRRGQMHRTHWVTLDGDLDWKMRADNFNESYHLPFVHPGKRFVMEQSYKDCQFDLYAPHGHARTLMPVSRPARSLRGQPDTLLDRLAPELTDGASILGFPCRSAAHARSASRGRRQHAAARGTPSAIFTMTS